MRLAALAFRIKFSWSKKNESTFYKLRLILIFLKNSRFKIFQTGYRLKTPKTYLIIMTKTQEAISFGGVYSSRY